MSRRSRAPSRLRQHLHCDSCYSRRCRTRAEEASVCCALGSCRLLCGAVYHLCKEEEHLLLCPNARVPCLNAEYGCSLQVSRSAQAAHLQVCPASVVCCSMEWLRWPADDTDPHGFTLLHDNVLKGAQEEALDVAMTLVDQEELCRRLRMKPLYPELMEEEEGEETEEEMKKEMAAGGIDGVALENSESEGIGGRSRFENSAATFSPVGQTAINTEKFNLFEMMFSMDKRACDVAQENLENAKQGKNTENGQRTQAERDAKQTESEDQTNTEKDGSGCPPHDTSKIGLAPWQEGVLERLGQELTPQEYNMYVVHHGRMLLSFGQIEACTPREKDFVYGSLEPIPVQTLRSFKVPESYHYNRRAHMYDTAARVQSEPKAVDTSDLGSGEDDWFGDETVSTLLGYAEMAVMGHKISETKGADGLYVDTGTQTHSFRSAPFKKSTTLADVMADKPLKLHLQLQAESVNSRNNRASCAFTFLCGHTFHRREFSTHFRNVHGDIQTALSGWFEQRCPLAYLGCTYSQRRFHPSTQKATVVYNKQLRAFNLRPALVPLLGESLPSSTDGVSTAQKKKGAQSVEDTLSSLPYEVLCHMASFLDSLSLSQLALVSRLMRQVVSSLLQERGMVTLRWEKKDVGSRGQTKWTAKPVWEFSHLFSPVDSWHMADTPPISAHLKVCPYYRTSKHTEPVLLPIWSDEQVKNRNKPSLINLLKAKR